MDPNERQMLFEVHNTVEILKKAILGNGQAGMLQDVAALKSELDQVKENIPSKLEKQSARASAISLLGMGALIIAKLMGIHVPI